MSSRLAKLGGCAGVVLATTGAALYYRDDIKLRASVLVDPPPSYKTAVSTRTNYYQDLFPRGQWDDNWDHRDPLNMVNHDAFVAADEATRKEMLKKVTPTATRHVFLIRHGQYHLDSEKRHLTELGREQAQLLGKRLVNADQKFDSVVYSTMTRATETAQLMMEQMQPLPSKSDSILEEGAPFPPEPPSPNWRPKYKKFFTDGSRIEAAFRRYIHRASPKQEKDTYELIVCHANVIRYFICRALQFPPEGWLRMSLGNTSITWVVIRPNGFVSIRAIGDAGHLPKGKLTFT